jgi:hypothetical protein
MFQILKLAGKMFPASVAFILHADVRAVKVQQCSATMCRVVTRIQQVRCLRARPRRPRTVYEIASGFRARG